METLGVVFLGVIALSSLVQGVVLILLARGGLEIARRLDELQTQIDRDLRPALENVGRLTRSLAEISELSALQARRVDLFVAGTLDRLEDTGARLREAVERPLGMANRAFAFLRGLRRGVQVYRTLGGLEDQGRRGRDYADDEHLFI